MKRLAILSAVLVIAHSTVASADTRVRSGDRVLLMGDSEAFLLSHDFPQVIGQGVTFKTVAFPGSSVISWAERQPREWLQVFAFRPQVILVSLGANDACTGPSVVRNEGPFLGRFLKKLQRVQAREIIWVGPPKIGYPTENPKQCTASRAVPGLELFAKMVKDAGVFYLDARQVNIELWSDYLHCSRPAFNGDPHNGCLTWASWVWGEIAPQEEDGC